VVQFHVEIGCLSASRRSTGAERSPSDAWTCPVGTVKAMHPHVEPNVRSLPRVMHSAFDAGAGGSNLMRWPD
jgi:hypothetical protein